MSESVQAASARNAPRQPIAVAHQGDQEDRGDEDGLAQAEALNVSTMPGGLLKATVIRWLDGLATR